MRTHAEANSQADDCELEPTSVVEQPAGNIPETPDPTAAIRPGDLDAALGHAKASGRFLVAVWFASGGRIHLYRHLNGLPASELSLAESLLHNDLVKLRADQGKSDNVQANLDRVVPETSRT